MTPIRPHATTRRAVLGRTPAYLLSVLLVALAALIGSAPAAEAASHTVVIQGYAYSPANLTISAGDTVTWTNKDSVAHDVSVMSGPQTFHSPMLAQGQSWSHTFSSSGSYSYMCSVHPDMVAKVTVRAPAAQPKPTKQASPVPATSPSATPTATQPAHSHHPPATTSPAPPAASAQPPTEAPVASAQVSAPATQDGATLDPLLLVAGVSAAVMVFCLLLMISRPVAKPVAPATAEADAT